MLNARRLWLGLGLAVCALVTAQITRAQQVADVTDASLEDLMKIKVSSASRYLQPASDAPAFVTVITRDEIERFGYRNLADALQRVAGFYVNYDHNYSYVGVRGFARPGDYNTKVLLLVNGHRLNDSVYDMASIGNEFPLDIDLVQRIEVMRGPGASVYGTSAFFAVINVITRAAEHNLPELEASFEALAFGGVKGRLSYSHGFGGWDTVISGSGFRSDGPTLFFPEFNSPVTNNGVTSGTDYESSYNTYLYVNRGPWRLEAVYGTRTKGVPTGSYGTDFNNPENHTVDDRGYVEMLYTRDIGKWSLNARAGYDQYVYAGDYVAPADSDGRRIVDHDYGRSDALSGELQAGTHVGKKHFLTMGTELRDNLRQAQGNYDVNPFTLWTDDHRSSTVLAAYAQDEYSFTPSLLANLGVRVDRYSTFGTTVNPRMALIWKPTSHTNAKLIYGSAFRAPNAYELYFENGSILSNPSLKPETIKTLEGIVEQSFGNHWHVSGSYFRNHISNLIGEESGPTPDTFMYRNSAGANAVGVSAQVDGRYDNGIAARAAYTYVDTDDAMSGGALSNSPHTLMKFGVSAPLARKWAIASWDGTFVSWRATLAGGSVPSYLRMDLTLLARQLGRGFQFAASIYNLANTTYWDPGSAEHVQDRLPQDGRAFRLKLTYALGARR